MDTTRRPIASGAFYPRTEAALLKQLQQLMGEVVEQPQHSLHSSVGLVVPHAGYVYSGMVAATGYHQLSTLGQPEYVIVIGANHTGMGADVSVDCRRSWRTPLGDVPIDTELAEEFLGDDILYSPVAFAREHSVEVQLPFLQYIYRSGLSFVPICILQPTVAQLHDTAEAIARIITTRGPGAIIASSDFTHYQPDNKARKIDHQAIQQVLALDVDEFYETVAKQRLSICGAGAISVLMAIGDKLGWNSTTQLDYATSADITGDRSSVVGYASIFFARRAND